MTAALPMGGQKITGMADPTVATDGATKNYVDTTTAAFFSTGDVKLTIKTVADSGWLLFDDGTFGSASSGSSNSNSANNQALFTLFFNNMLDANAPILTSGGGATTRAAQSNAGAAWAANCRMSLPKTLGRALGVAGSGSGLTARALGSTVGNETTTLSQANLPLYSLPVTDPGHNHAIPMNGDVGVTAGTSGLRLSGPVSNTANATTGISVSSGGSGTAHSIMQPEVFLNAMIKV